MHASFLRNLVPACKFWLKLQLEPNRQAGTFVSGVGPQYNMSVMRPIGTVWSTRANPFCLRRTWLTFSGLWVSSIVPVARITSGKCGAPCGKFAICLSQTKSLRISPVVAVRYPCAALFAWLPSADDATKVWAASNSPSWDLGVGSVCARTLSSVAMRLGGCSQLAGPFCRMQRSSGFQVTDLIPPAIWRVIFAAELNSLYDRAGARIHEVLAACRCWQQGEALWKDPLVDVPEAEAVFLDPVDRSQRALAAWVLPVAASPPEVPMPHANACVLPWDARGGRRPRRRMPELQVAFCQDRALG